MGTQWLNNGSFESAISGWTVPLGGTFVSTTGDAEDGTKHGLVTITTTSSYTITSPLADKITGLTAGDKVSVRAWFKDCTRNAAVGIKWMNSGGTQVGGNDVATKTAVSSGGAAKYHSSACPFGATQAELLLAWDTGANPTTCKVDGAVLIDQDNYMGGYLAHGASPPALTGWDFVILNLDDAATEDIDKVPQFAAFAEEAITFTNYYVTDPSCSPSRASFMTGTNACNNQVPNVNNATQAWIDDDFDDISIATMWTGAGGTAHALGKFLHDMMEIPGYHPAGWTTSYLSDVVYRQFACEVRHWNGATLTELTTGTDEDDYLTDDITARAAAIIAAADPDVPLALYLAVGNDHGNHGEDPDTVGKPVVSAAPRHRPEPTGSAQINKWDDLNWDPDAGGPNGDCGDDSCTTIGPFYDESAPWNNSPMLNAPGWHDPTMKGSGGLNKTQEQNRDRVRSLQSAGEALDAVIAALTSAGRYGNTCIIVNSDNGWHDAHWGQPPSKGALYPTDTRIRMILRPPGGTTPQVVDDFVTHADLYPTMLEAVGITIPDHVDGLSLMPVIDEDAGRDKRQRVPLRFRTNKTWDQLLEGGQPAPADGITGLDVDGNEVLFITYEPGATTAPPVEKGQFHVLTGPDADPYLMNNRYAELTTACRDAYMADLVATHAAAGPTARAIALDALPAYEFGAEESPEAPPTRFKINDVDLADIGIIVSDFSWLAAGRRGSNDSLPGKNGAWPRPDKRLTQAEFTMAFTILGVNDDGSDPSGVTQSTLVRSRRDYLHRLLNIDQNFGSASTDGLVPFEIVYPDEVHREWRAEIPDPFGFSVFGRPLTAIAPIHGIVPEGCARDTERTPEDVPLGWNPSQTEGIVQFLALTGGSAGIEDAILTLYGRMPGPVRIYDKLLGTGIKYDDDLEAGQRLVIDSGKKTARLYEDDDDHDGTNVRALIDRIAGSGYCWIRLIPSPNNARYSVYLDLGGSPSSDAAVGILAARRYADV